MAPIITPESASVIATWATVIRAARASLASWTTRARATVTAGARAPRAIVAWTTSAGARAAWTLAGTAWTGSS
jgi:hypothetical protein